MPNYTDLTAFPFSAPPFHPKTALEIEIYSCFQELQCKYDGLLMFVDYSYERRYAFVTRVFSQPVSDPKIRAQAFQDFVCDYNCAGTGEQVLVALDLGRPFDEQWPYEAGLDAPAYLRQHPILPPKSETDAFQGTCAMNYTIIEGAPIRDDRPIAPGFLEQHTCG